MRPQPVPPFALFFGLAAFALAAVLIAPARTESDPPSRLPVKPAAGRPAHPVAVEFDDIVASRQDRLRSLRARLAGAGGPEEDLALQREIQRIKLETDVAMLEVQLRHAEETGNARLVGQIQSALEAYRTLGRKREAEAVPMIIPAAPGEEEAR